MIDFLIVGHGLAGSVLAHLLVQSGKRVVVLEAALPHSASKVAAGLVNPLIGPKFNVPLHMEECLRANERFFRPFEQELGRSLQRELSLHRILTSSEQRELWLKKSKRPDLLPYGPKTRPPEDYQSLGLDAPFGGGIHLARQLDVSGFLRHSEEKLRQDDCWLDGAFAEEEWTHAEKIVFCEGFRVTGNPWFGDLPFAPAQGEILCLHAALPVAASNGKWIVPDDPKGSLAGSTWKHESLESGPTNEGKDEILQGLDFVPAGLLEVTDHLSGVRSGTRDRDPIIGRHWENHRMHLFNGFGSRGATTLAFYARRMRDFLLDNRPLPLEGDLGRFARP